MHRERRINSFMGVFIDDSMQDGRWALLLIAPESLGDFCDLKPDLDALTVAMFS